MGIYSWFEDRWLDVWYGVILRFRYGFDIRDCWNLGKRTAEYLLPRLIYFRKHMSDRVPVGLCWQCEDRTIEWNESEHGPREWFSSGCGNPCKKWGEILDEIIWALTEISDDSYCGDDKRKQNGLKLLAEHFETLWC